MNKPNLRIQSNQTNAPASGVNELHSSTAPVSQKNTPVVKQPFTPKTVVSGGSARLTF